MVAQPARNTSDLLDFHVKLWQTTMFTHSDEKQGPMWNWLYTVLNCRLAILADGTYQSVVMNPLKKEMFLPDVFGQSTLS